jgi:hypothetical protein
MDAKQQGRTQGELLDLGCWRKELESPAPAHDLCDDDEDETSSDDSSLHTECHRSTRPSNPLSLEVCDAETAY